jgi:MFS family permease
MERRPFARTPRRLWAQPDYRRLLISTGVSQLGTQVSELALPLTAIVVLHASPLAVGVLAACGYLPIAILGLPAGAWIDEVRRRRVLIVADIGRAITMASVPLAFALGGLTLTQLFVVALIIGGFTVFFDIAYTSYLPSIVERADLLAANVGLQASEQGAAVVGPGVAGIMIALLRAPVAIALDALSYVVSAAFVTRIASREPAPVRAAARERLRSRIAIGLRYVVGDRYLRAISIASAVINLFGRMVVVVVVIYLVRTAHYSPTVIGLIFSAGAVGFLVGSVLADRTVRRFGIGPAILWGGSVAAGAMTLIAAAPPAWAGPFVAVGLFVYGLGALVFTVANATLRQAQTPPELLGRTTSSMRFLAWIAQPIAGILAGVLATALGLKGAMWVGAIGAAMAPLPLVASGLRSLRHVPQRVPSAST